MTFQGFLLPDAKSKNQPNCVNIYSTVQHQAVCKVEAQWGWEVGAVAACTDATDSNCDNRDHKGVGTI